MAGEAVPIPKLPLLSSVKLVAGALPLKLYPVPLVPPLNVPVTPRLDENVAAPEIPMSKKFVELEPSLLCELNKNPPFVEALVP